jgi:hypothetical protein
MLPEPLAPRPFEVFVLVHAYVVPTILLAKAAGAIISAGHFRISASAVKVGRDLTIIWNVIGALMQELIVPNTVINPSYDPAERFSGAT